MLIKYPLSCFSNHNQLLQQITERLGVEPLRWGAVSFNEEDEMISIEAIPCPWRVNKLKPIERAISKSKLGVMLIPTGLGCSIGGFGGDANLCANLLAGEFDYLVINPNVVNGGAWQNIPQNSLYVEGLAVDLFMCGQLALRPVTYNKIGVIFDKAIPGELLQRELEVIKAAECIWGIDCLGYTLTENPLEYSLQLLDSNCSSGNINNPQVLLNAADKLKAKGAQAIAVVCHFDEKDPDKFQLPDEAVHDYQQGQGPDPIGGLEAIISHLITRYSLLPCAHAPCLSETSCSVENVTSIDMRVSPEKTSFSFLPSVLKGLSKAPHLITQEQLSVGDLTVHNVQAFIGPANCWGGSSFISAAHNQFIRCYAVESNLSKANVNPELLSPHIKKVTNHFELIGHLRAQSLGLKFMNY